MSAARGDPDRLNAATGRREQEMQKIMQLRQRLDAAKQDVNKDRVTKTELAEFQSKCKALLSQAEQLTNQVAQSIEADKRQLANLHSQLNTQVRDARRVDELQAQLDDLARHSNANSQMQMLQKQLQEQTALTKSLEQERDQYQAQVEALRETTGAGDEMMGVELKSDEGNMELDVQNKVLVSHIKFLQGTFESDEALARALYVNLAADAIPSPNRCGWLTKQGGSVKSWKRRYFVLKDNFLFYYKKPRDDSPTGVIQLEDCQVRETPSEETDRKNCFSLNTSSRVWLFQADRQIEMDIWIDCISHAENWWSRDVIVTQGTLPTEKPMHVHQQQHKQTEKKSRFRFSSYITSPSK